MFNAAAHPMALYGALTSLLVFGIFIGTWWWYAIRADDLRDMIARGEALLLHVEPKGALSPDHIAGGTHIPLEELASRVAELGPRSRTVVVCEHGSGRTAKASRLLRGMGFRTRQIDHAHAA